MDRGRPATFVAANFAPSLQKSFQIANENAFFGSTTASFAVSLQIPNPTHAKTATNAHSANSVGQSAQSAIGNPMRSCS
jgi:hypothetical protein